MLAFDRPVATAENAFYDATDPGRIHVLPTRLAPVDPGTSPDVSLLLFRSPQDRIGGVFQARLAPQIARDTAGEIAYATSLRARITPRVPGIPDHLGSWHSVMTDSDGAVAVQIHLDGTDAQLMRELALDGASTLDLTLEMDIAGMAAGLAVVAHLPGEQLWDALDAALGSTDFDRVAFEQAFLSLPTDMPHFVATGSTNLRDRNLLLKETAARAVHILLNPQPFDGAQALYRLIPREQVGPASITLEQPLAVTRAHRVTFSLSDFTASLDDVSRATVFPVIHSIAPFEDAMIRVLNEIPLSEKQAFSATVDVACPNPGGTLENHRIKYRPGDPVSQSITARFPAIVQPFEVKSRLSLMLHPGPAGGFPLRWPRQPEFESEDDPFTVRLSPQRLNIALIRFVADEDVFGFCTRLRARFVHDGGETVADVDQENAEAWVVLPGHSNGAVYQVLIEAIPSEELAASPVLIRDGPETANAILISRFEVTVKTPDRVSARIEAPEIRFAVLEVTQPATEFISRRVLRPGDETSLSVWRLSPFHSLTFDWRASVVRTDATGRTRPIEHLPWVRGTNSEVRVH